MSRRVAVALSCLVLVAGLSACVAEPRPRLTAVPDASPSLSAVPEASTAATPTPDAAVVPGCVDGVLRIGASSQSFTVTADCPRLEVSGSAVEVSASDAEIAEVIIRGEGNTVIVADPQQITVEGQGNDVEAVTAGTVEVRGNRNQIFVDGTLSLLTVNGNTNGVQALQIGSVTDNGDGNVIGLR